MLVTWRVDDGYAGGDAPHHTEVPDDELAICNTQEERDALIDSYIEEDFRQNITWYRERSI